jgi:hypothetical protein
VVAAAGLAGPGAPEEGEQDDEREQRDQERGHDGRHQDRVQQQERPPPAAAGFRGRPQLGEFRDQRDTLVGWAAGHPLHGRCLHGGAQSVE